MPEDVTPTPVPPPTDAPPPAAAGPIPPAALVEPGRTYAPDPASVPADRIGWVIFDLIVGVVTFVVVILFWFVIDGETLPRVIISLIGASVVGLCLFGTMYIPQRAFRTTRYTVDGEGIEIRKGIWWKRVINVPRSRIQHTDVRQGPVSRRFGIAKLVIHTAGSINYNVELEGLAHDTALAVRAYLLDRGTGA